MARKHRRGGLDAKPFPGVAVLVCEEMLKILHLLVS